MSFKQNKTRYVFIVCNLAANTSKRTFRKTDSDFFKSIIFGFVSPDVWLLDNIHSILWLKFCQTEKLAAPERSSNTSSFFSKKKKNLSISILINVFRIQLVNQKTYTQIQWSGYRRKLKVKFYGNSIPKNSKKQKIAKLMGISDSKKEKNKPT